MRSTSFPIVLPRSAGRRAPRMSVHLELRPRRARRGAMALALEGASWSGHCHDVRRSERYVGSTVQTGRTASVKDALSALSAEELRLFVGEALERLDANARAVLEDRLLQHAARSSSGWKPAPPSTAVVGQATTFAAIARRQGEAEPSAVEDFLRYAITASLAGDHVSARTVFEALLVPISNGDILLGQDETVDEVLSIDLHECMCRFASAVYVTTPIAARVDALLRTLDDTHGLSHLRDPVGEIATTLGGELPDVEAFMPLWIARLELESRSSSDWESDRERWLRTAIGRRDGVAGLERMARATKRHEAARAWCDALVAAGDWSTALFAYKECAVFIERDYLRGEFLDGAALAAQVLGNNDLVNELETAWLGAPSLTRLVRWLLAGEPSAATLRKRAAEAIDRNSTKAARVVGVLSLLTGNIARAAHQLTESAGLGWSHGDHPGHVIFPAFAWLLAGTPSGSVREELARILHSPVRDLFDFEGAIRGDAQTPSEPKLPNPTIIDALQRAEVMARLSRDDRRLMLDAMKAAAALRTDGVLDAKRRGHYAHAALLVACCVELEDGRGKAVASSAWAVDLRARTTRFPAFQRELHAALSRVQRVTV